MLDWDAFRVILAIHREGSLVGAGRNLGITHVTVGRQLKRAEEQLGAKLFDRFSTGLFPTEQGKTAIRYAERIESEVENMNLRLLGTDSAMEGALRISVPLNLVGFGFSRDLAKFQETYPDIYLQVNASDEPVSFLSRDVDVVVRAHNEPANGLWGYRIATVSYSFYGSDEFLRTWQSLITADPARVKVPYIALNDTDPWRDRDQLLRAFPAAVTVAETNGLDSVLPMVREGVGLGRVANFMASEYDDLKPVISCEDACSRSLWVLTHPDLRRTRRIRAFLEFLRSRFEGRAHEFG